MEKKYKLMPFNIEKAKSGAEVVTKKENLRVEILKYDLNAIKPILAIVTYKDGGQAYFSYYANGWYLKNDTHRLDLLIKEEVKVNYRRMTEQELSWWLRDCPKEHREYKFESRFVNLAKSTFEYQEENTNVEVDESVVIRSNGGEWKEPLVEIE